MREMERERAGASKGSLKRVCVVAFVVVSRFVLFI